MAKQKVKILRKLKRSRTKKKKVKFLAPKEFTGVWNKRKTLKQNLQEIGLTLDVNKVSDKYSAPSEIYDEQKEYLENMKQIKAQEIETGNPLSSSMECEVLEEMDKSVFEQLCPVPAKPPKREKSLSEDERNYYRKLIDKHGTNYEAMARDMKLNYYQQTATVCEKKCKLYEEKYRNASSLPFSSRLRILNAKSRFNQNKNKKKKSPNPLEKKDPYKVDF